MADNYTCLQDVTFFEVDISEYSNNVDTVAYFLKKQSETLTSLDIWSSTMDLDLKNAISKCKNLKKFRLHCWALSPECLLNGGWLESLSNLRYLCLGALNNSDLGHFIEVANFQHLKELEFDETSSLSDNDVSRIAQKYGQQV
jgi:hypothetical protein